MTTKTELDLTAWCRQRAKSHHVYETRELAYYPTDESRDVALVEWTVRTLGNPSLPESVEALRILAERHGMELVPASAEAEATR